MCGVHVGSADGHERHRRMKRSRWGGASLLAAQRHVGLFWSQKSFSPPHIPSDYRRYSHPRQGSGLLKLSAGLVLASDNTSVVHAIDSRRRQCHVRSAISSLV
eukprot:4875734-Prymnesium_polylepis.2